MTDDRAVPLEPAITDHLRAWNDADPEALRRLMPEVVDELRGLARRYFLRERSGHTLQPTALVNEVYLRLAGGQVGKLADRGQFFAFAARLMRQILVDHARGRRTSKRGGGLRKLSLDDVPFLSDRGGLDLETLLLVDNALDRLGALDPRQRSIVELRYFGGLTLPEIAEILGVSVPTIERSWRVARRWLAREIGPGAEPG